MNWTLFLDDERMPKYNLGDDVLIARDCEEAKDLIADYGCPTCISFDHDLGSDENGMVRPTALKFLHWLIDEDLDGLIDLKKITRVIVHSLNPTGARNIASLWDGYASSELKSDVRAEISPYN
jgi:hypothetical protein